MKTAAFYRSAIRSKRNEDGSRYGLYWYARRWLRRRGLKVQS